MSDVSVGLVAVHPGHAVDEGFELVKDATEISHLASPKRPSRRSEVNDHQEV
jgi:hypothetical protein